MTIIALLTIVAVVAGCGASNGTDATSGGAHMSLTKAQFVKQGDQICRRNYTKREKLLIGYLAKAKKEGSPPPEAVQEELLVDHVMPIFREESEELNKLGPPTNDTKKAEAILRALEGAIAAVESEPKVAIERGTKVQFAQAERLAHSYGFEYCGRS